MTISHHRPVIGKAFSSFLFVFLKQVSFSVILLWCTCRRNCMRVCGVDWVCVPGMEGGRTKKERKESQEGTRTKGVKDYGVCQKNWDLLSKIKKKNILKQSRVTLSLLLQCKKISCKKIGDFKFIKFCFLYVKWTDVKFIWLTL